MRTSALLLLGAAAAAEAFTGAPALGGLRSAGVTSLYMAQAAPPASGKALPKAKIEALAVNAEQWGIKAEGAQSGSQAAPPASGRELPKAKLEALAVNEKQWGIGGSASSAPAAEEEMEPVVIAPGVDYIAKLEALSTKYIKKLEAA